ncbi:MAG: carboxypeptidase-like regulatory domain-containing protein [Chitinophagales bacterium]
MADDNNIKNFAASDIEKYHKGQLSAKERHALEKAALDDPFLADALEGYSTQGVNASSDMAELRRRLSEKTEQAKVIPIAIAEKSSFPWLRAAVVIILVAGAGLLAYQFLFKADNKIEIAQSTSSKENKSSDSSQFKSEVTGNDSSLAGIFKEKSFDDKAATGAGAKQEPLTVTTNANTSDKPNNTEPIDPEVAVKSPKIPVPLKIPETKDGRTDDLASQKQDPAGRNNNSDLSRESSKVALNKPAVKDTVESAFADADYYKRKAETDVKGVMAKRQSENFRTNVFRGKVTDASNSPLPFANITNKRDNVGTYSDAQGNFTLVSPDTVMDVQVKSLGFENSNVQMRSFAATNKIVMEEDRSLDARVLDTVKHNISRARSKTMTFEEPEPEDGWTAYNSYVLNNLNMPEKIDKKKSEGGGENTVEISFEVNQFGDPVKIKVEKSLCDRCDKEAVRLIKEGPKWKRKGKKGKRTTVSVPFLKTD